MQTTGWDQCIVVNSTGVVLGLVRGEALHAAPDARVELAMEAGPTTIRPDRSPRDIRAYMRQHGVASAVVTTPAGQLIGIVARQDIERCLAPAVQPHQSTYQAQRGTPGVEIGYKLSCEEHSPSALVGYAKQAEEAGFTFAMLSDHYHPWIAEQGQSPFVWSVIGSIAQATVRLRVGTGVTCPLIRMHPAIIAQAAATAAALLPGRFMLGVGTGENLNEHIFGDYWPPGATRRAMLEEAVALMRHLWQGGLRSHHGQYYTVENAQLYTLPELLPPVLIAASGTRSAQMAGRLGDGLITVGVHAKLVDRFIAAGGAGKPRYTELNVCWALKKQRRDAWPMRGGPSLACREHSSQTSDSRPILRKLLAPSRRRRSRRQSSAAPIPHVTLRQSRRQPRQGIHTSGSTRSGQIRQAFSSSTPAKSCPSSINSGRTARCLLSDHVLR